MRKRIINRMYELAQICVPAEVAEFILSKKEWMRDGKSRQVYEELRAERNLSHTYKESQRLQYLTELFWVMGHDARVTVLRVGERECVPTCFLERDVSSFGFDKVQPCVVLSLRVAWSGQDRKQLYERMESVVEEKMRSFKTDFYFHDMMTLSREAMHHPLLWTVSTSHTFMEVHDAEDESDGWAAAIATDGDRVRRMLNGYDDTWMGSALRVSCAASDLYFYHDGAQLHELTREKFQAIHDRHVSRVRELTREKVEKVKLKKAV